ncbi:MAG: bifunctional 4-hydroxy-2-oxoglutarate aldolase/2-dehydro-3-deoxy-phosphogluconate aldolase [Acetobacteraceae bacterium]|jgi:2-dehydro-3-deoxyphosphogluconate aldolase/(4S)-4-hydroxy-2-oxoglutarate aldolase
MDGHLLQSLRAARVVPVVRTHNARHASTVVQWLRDAGLRIFEITMTIPNAPSLIRELAADPSLLIGAGTVPDRATAEVCLAAGARFIVAPWIDATLAAPCQAANAVLMLGALTPTEVRAALAAERRRGEGVPGILCRRPGAYTRAAQRIAERCFLSHRRC